MYIYLTGAAIVKDDIYVTRSIGTKNMKVEELFQASHLKAVFGKKSSRYGRFDRYTLLGCVAAGLALHDADLVADSEHPIGFILAGQYGSLVTDLAFYETTAGCGRYASPNLFSYTLPNIVIGECALQYGLTGPTYCLDSEGGRAIGALCEAAWHLKQNTVDAMLAGWMEVLPSQAPAADGGAIVFVFEKQKNNHKFQLELEIDDRAGLQFPGGEGVDNIDDLLRKLEMTELVEMVDITNMDNFNYMKN